MDNTNKMLRAVINGQSAMKAELLEKITGIDKKLSSKLDGLTKETRLGFKQVNKRVMNLTVWKSVSKL